MRIKDVNRLRQLSDGGILVRARRLRIGSGSIKPPASPKGKGSGFHYKSEVDARDHKEIRERAFVEHLAHGLNAIS